MAAIALIPKSSPSDLLDLGLRQMGLSICDDSREGLLRFVAMLEKWNKVYNLTAVREPERMIGLHILDSLSVLPHLGRATSVLDVGTGGGLPGIPMAIVLAAATPGVRITMLDTITKKTAFVRHAIGELNLRNAEVVTERVEKYQPPGKFDVVLSRAFAELKDFTEYAGHLCAPNGRMLAMKGVHPFDEIARLPPAVLVVEVVPLQVPQVDGQRHLVVIRPRKDEK